MSKLLIDENELISIIKDCMISAIDKIIFNIKNSEDQVISNYDDLCGGAKVTILLQEDDGEIG